MIQRKPHARLPKHKARLTIKNSDKGKKEKIYLQYATKKLTFLRQYI